MNRHVALHMTGALGEIISKSKLITLITDILQDDPQYKFHRLKLQATPAGGTVIKHTAPGTDFERCILFGKDMALPASDKNIIIWDAGYLIFACLDGEIPEDIFENLIQDNKAA